MEKRYKQMEPSHDFSSTPFLLTIAQAAKMLNLGRTKVHELINKENLPIHKFGRATRISPIELQQWLQERNEQQYMSKRVENVVRSHSFDSKLRAFGALIGQNGDFLRQMSSSWRQPQGKQTGPG